MATLTLTSHCQGPDIGSLEAWWRPRLVCVFVCIKYCTLYSVYTIRTNSLLLAKTSLGCWLSFPNGSLDISHAELDWHTTPFRVGLWQSWLYQSHINYILSGCLSFTHTHTHTKWSSIWLLQGPSAIIYYTIKISNFIINHWQIINEFEAKLETNIVLIFYGTALIH